MSAYRALVVDDSKTAQHRLKRMLKRYDVSVDTATSAEQALGYLTHTLPTVIFMDHHMQGMDGLEALKIIKANPTTAMIPVIMYTSQSGDVYVGRAHALGALDILSKEVIKQSNLEAVLSKLKIHAITQEEDEEAGDTEVLETLEEQTAQSSNTDSAPTSPDDELARATTDKEERTNNNDEALEIPELRQQVARLFELHIADVRTQITENTKFMIRRLTNEIKANYAKHEKINDIDPVEVALKASENTRTTPLASYLLLAVILLIVTAISVKTFQPDNTSQAIAATQAELNAIKAELQVLAGNNFEPADDYTNNSKIDTYGLLEALGAAADLNTQFTFNSAPLDSEKQLALQTLIDKMDGSGFKGFIEITVHTGNFCVAAAATGEWILAKPDTPIGQCVFSKNQPTEQQEVWIAQGYSDLEAISDPIKSGDIELAITLATSENQRAGYPELEQNITAKMWNKVATKNNYLTLRFESAE